MKSNFLDRIYEAHKKPKGLPGMEEVEVFINNILQFLFPELNNKRLISKKEVEVQFHLLQLDFESLLYKTEACENTGVKSICKQFFGSLEAVYDLCIRDSIALLEGDPAAYDNKEVIRTYPGFFAIAVYRIAHRIHQIGVPYLPRILTEYAHTKTGIDIHPGAQIGESFCIDHGTGVVIGETTVIGNHVKLYQGVTLGALSVTKEMARQKRHPTIEEGVIIYAEATILGGRTVIGKNSIIGGNVWITKSVPPNSKIYYSQKEHQIVLTNESEKDKPTDRQHTSVQN
ncbi:MAG: serine acetyltransferase [Bacteroidetes bacterium]|nr:serine acetyltransferase [Bacteroidota bacterium]